MTQKMKLAAARMMAMRIKSVARDLRSDAREYDCRFPLEHAARLETIAEEFLNAK